MCCRNGRRRTKSNRECGRGRTTPSVVAFKDNEILVGEVAKRQAYQS